MANVIIYTCAYNAEKTIARTIESVMNQTYQDFVYILINNASTDGTEEIMRAYGHKYKDKIYMHNLHHNDLRNYGLHFLAFNFMAQSISQWATIIDADDEWTPDFLEKTVKFGEDNDLYLVACGYDKIDAVTSELIKRRTAPQNLIVSGDGFKDDFINYRGFCNFWWGKLYKIANPMCVDYGIAGDHKMYEDSLFTLSVVKSLYENNWKFGVISDTCFKYYIDKNSYSFTKIELAVETYEELYEGTKYVLESFGKVSKLNRDFLYAIYLSIMNDIIEWILFSGISDTQKIIWIEEVLRKPLAAETFARKEFDARIKSLAERDVFLDSIGKKVQIMANKSNSVLVDRVNDSITALKKLL